MIADRENLMEKKKTCRILYNTVPMIIAGLVFAHTEDKYVALTLLCYGIFYPINEYLFDTYWMVRTYLQ